MKNTFPLFAVCLFVAGCAVTDIPVQEENGPGISSDHSAAQDDDLIALKAEQDGAVGASFVADENVQWRRVKSPFSKEAEIENRIDAILSSMSLKEKVGQITMAEIQSISPKDVRKFHIGGLLNGGGSYPNENKTASIAEWLVMANAFYDASMDDRDRNASIPVIWGTDAVHGHNNVVGATLFPHNIGLGAMNNPELMRDIGVATAREVAVTGIDWTFAPTVAVARDDRWGRTYESYSEDPALVASYAKEIVVGLQGHPVLENSFTDGKIVATAKHFLGDGGTTDGDDQGNTEITEKQMFEIHAPGHVAALGAGVQTVMATFNSWNGVKTHGNKYLLTTVLKEKLGFDGFVVGDWNGHEQIPGCTVSNCAEAVNAGVDMIMVPTEWRGFIRNTLRQVKNGDIPEDRLDDAVRRILRVKIRAGLFEKSRPSWRRLAGNTELIGYRDHRALARRAVRESLVLLKNDQILPLNPGSHILVAGEGATSMKMQSGGWSVSWQGRDGSNEDFPGATTIYSGIEQAVTNAGGSTELRSDAQFSKRPDAAIVVFGETPYAEFEGDLETDRGVDFVDEKALKILMTLQEQAIPTVAVFLTGRPRWVSPEIDSADAFVVAWLPGTEGGGIADVLFTDADGNTVHDFKGRLSFSWPNSPNQQPINIGDDAYSPLYPFGFGLSYEDK